MLLGLFWSRHGDLATWRSGLFAATLFGVGVPALVAWRRSPAGMLRWDGQGWHWSGSEPPVAGVLAVHLDLQFCLVLCLMPPAGPRIWLWPERGSDAALWSALRRAAFSDNGVRQTHVAATDPNRAQVNS